MLSYLRRLKAESIHVMRVDDRMALQEGEIVSIESAADSAPAVIDEVLALRTSERTGRRIDHDQSGSMERKKREGCF